MTIHNFYMFDRNGTLIYYGEWNRKKPATMPKEEEGKLVYGMLFSLRSFLEKISPLDFKNGNTFTYRTSKYKLTYWESPSGVKFVLNTDLNAANVIDLLRSIYQQVYVEYVVKNPLILQPSSATTGTAGHDEYYITSELFTTKLDELIKSSYAYNLISSIS